jgi:hypothetical protein
MLSMKRSPRIDELSDIGTDHLSQVRSNTPRHRGTGTRICAAPVPRVQNIDFASPDPPF